MVVGGIISHVGSVEFVELQIRKLTVLGHAVASFAAEARHNAAQPLGAHIAAQVFVGFPCCGLGAGLADKAALAGIFGVEFKHRLAGGVRPREEIQRGVVGLCGSGEQAFDEGNWFGMGIGFAEHRKPIRSINQEALIFTMLSLCVAWH